MKLFILDLRPYGGSLIIAAPNKTKAKKLSKASLKDRYASTPKILEKFIRRIDSDEWSEFNGIAYML